MNRRKFKDQVYGELTKVAKALANPYRLEIVCLLAQKEFTVEELAGEVQISVANTSQHLQTLKLAKLVKTHRHGHFIRYSLGNKKVYRLWMSMSELSIEMNAEVQKVLSDYRKKIDTLEPVTMADLRKRSDLSDHIILDVRPSEEYQSGSLPDAISIPLGELANRLDELDKKKKIIAYCRGPFCVFADEAVQLLRQKGFQAERMDKKYADWESYRKVLKGK